MKKYFQDLQYFYRESKAQDFAFYMAALYLIFSYLRPQVLFPVINFLPWTQITIVAGIIYLVIKSRLKIYDIHVALFVFCLIAVASSFLSLYPDISFRKLHVVFIWLGEVIFFTNCIQSLKQLKLITILFFIILFKMSLFGAKTWVSRGFGFTGWGIAGPDGFFANSGEFSLLMAMLAVMSFAFIVGSKDAINIDGKTQTRTIKKLYFLLPLTAAMTVMGASSRGGQLALFVSSFFIIAVLFKIRIKTLALIVLAIVVTINFIPEQQKARFSTAGQDDTSVARLTYWKAGIEMANKYKFFGTGYYTFSQYFSDHYTSPFEDESTGYTRKEVAHNSFVEVGSTLGYIGLIWYSWLIFLCHKANKITRRILKSNKSKDKYTNWIYCYSIGLDGAIIAYLIGSFFMSVAFYPYIYFLIMFTYVLKTVVTKELGYQESENIRLRSNFQNGRNILR